MESEPSITHFPLACTGNRREVFRFNPFHQEWMASASISPIEGCSRTRRERVTDTSANLNHSLARRLFNHLVGLGEEKGRDGEPQGGGRLQVHDQSKPRGFLDGNLAGAPALQDLVNKASDSAEFSGVNWAIRDKAAIADHHAVRHHRCNAVSQAEASDPF